MTNQTSRNLFLEIVESQIKTSLNELTIEKQVYANQPQKLKDSEDFWAKEIHQLQTLKSAYLQAKYKAQEADGQLNRDIMVAELQSVIKSSNLSLEIHCLDNGEWHIS